jgi:hypothetical protein
MDASPGTNIFSKGASAATYARAWATLALLIACLEPFAWAQDQETTLKGWYAQVADSTCSQEGTNSPSQSQPKKEPERIYGVVPAYSLTDARNAPPLTSREKFKLFIRRLGLAGFFLACLLIIFGVLAATDALKRNAPIGRTHNCFTCSTLRTFWFLASSFISRFATAWTRPRTSASSISGPLRCSVPPSRACRSRFYFRALPL